VQPLDDLFTTAHGVPSNRAESEMPAGQFAGCTAIIRMEVTDIDDADEA
jgi:hypothetical protein